MIIQTLNDAHDTYGQSHAHFHKPLCDSYYHVPACFVSSTAALLFEAIQHSECVVKPVWIYTHTNDITDQQLSSKRGWV